ncbi:MAG: hypothetical protein OEZ06_00020 [Myxococcales bacterium]|nr:hypothetical protein [Myxococcales bacterium]
MHRALHAAAPLLLLIIGSRMFSLEANVAALSLEVSGTERARAAAGAEVSAPAAAPGLKPQPAPSAVDQQRLQALSRELERLQEELVSLRRGLGKPLSPDALSGAASPESILTVLREQDRQMLEKRFAFFRKKWTRKRVEGAERFADHAQLSAQQRAQLRRLIEEEVSAMTTLLALPETMEDPKNGARRWNDILRETDRGAEAALDVDQLEQWQQLRKTERRQLWPWLPGSEEE